MPIQRMTKYLKLISYNSHRIIIIEGIYLQLTQPEPWNKIPPYFDEMWFVEVDVNEAKQRTGQRHFEAGLGKYDKLVAYGQSLDTF